MTIILSIYFRFLMLQKGYTFYSHGFFWKDIGALVGKRSTSAAILKIKTDYS